MPNVYSETGLASGTGYTYAVAAKGSGLWTAFEYVDVPSWTTDLWNASAEHSGTWFWGSTNGGLLGNSVAYSDGSQSLQLTSPSGGTVSAYQDLAFHQVVCPAVDVRREPGQGLATVKLALWGMGPGNELLITDPWLIPDDGLFYRLWFGGAPGCRAFGSTSAALRFEVYLESAGSIQIDRARLVYDANTFGTP